MAWPGEAVLYTDHGEARRRVMTIAAAYYVSVLSQSLNYSADINV